jgi:hypothetical protein
MINTIYKRWLKKEPSLKEEEYVIILAEGLGDYKGKQNSYAKARNLHSLGRIGAELGIFKNGKLIYSTKNASTLADIPMDIYGKFNDKTATPTVCTGVYSLYTKLHKKKNAFELGLYSQKIPVIRNSKKYVEYKSDSSGIDLHYRTLNDSNLWGNSTGCQTVLKEDFMKILEIIGKWDNGKYLPGKYVGKLIIDRSQINSTLRTRYKTLYGDYFDQCFNLKDNDIIIEEPKVTINNKPNIPQWWIDGVNGLIEEGVVSSPDYWNHRINEYVKVGEICAIINKAIKMKKL